MCVNYDFHEQFTNLGVDIYNVRIVMDTSFKIKKTVDLITDA